MTISEALALVDSMLDTVQQGAVEATALADDATPATCRQGYAVIATGIARARHQLEFCIALLDAPEDPDDAN